MDCTLSYTREGCGPPLVLLHGNGEDSSYFGKQTAYFKRRFDVIAVDTRGHGNSPRGSAPFTLTQFAEDLKGLFDRLELTQINLLGFSDGANIAMLFALKYPDYLSRLILNGGNLFPTGMKPGVLLPLWARYLFLLPVSRISGSAFRRRELLRLMLKEPKIAPARLSDLKLPALVIAGERDMIRRSHTKLIARMLPNGRLCILKGDHFIAAKNSGGFNRAVECFLDERMDTP